MKISITKQSTPFQYPFTISKGTKTHQDALFVSLQHFGITGYGEAPAIPYYDVSVHKMAEALEAKKIFVEKFAYTEPERFWHYLHHLFPPHPFLVAALDIASWDLFGKMRNLPLYRFWHQQPFEKTATDYTLGIDDPEKMVEKMKAHPWPVYKVKLGTNQDIPIIEAIRKHTSAPLRIDANAAWSTAEALRNIDAFKALNIEFIEQPLAKDNWDGMKVLMKASSIPLLADESCVYEQDVARCLDHFHGINIKLTKCSGITPALRMIQQARQLGLSIMLGSMNETGIGSAAIIHLACLVDYLDADGPLLLQAGNTMGLQYENGMVTVPQQPGLGIVPGFSI